MPRRGRSAGPVGGVGLRREAEVGEGAVGVQVVDDSDDAAIAEVEYGGDPCVHLTEVNSARLTAPAMADQHKDTFTVEFSVLLCHGTVAAPGAQEVTPALDRKSTRLNSSHQII